MSANTPFGQQVTWVYTDDLAGTAGFYTDVVGLPLVHDQGLCRIFQVAGDAFLGVCQARPGRQVEPRGVVVTFVCPDTAGVDTWHRRLIANGAEPEGPPERHDDFNVYCFFLRDPNGYLLEVQSFLDPAWQGGG